METVHKIIFGDSRKMSLVKDKSVDLIITSPPYWQLKDYGNGRQIGFNDNYEDYINSLNMAWKECYRVLRNGCRLCVNIGDQFARSVYYGRYKVIPIRTEIIRFCETVGFDYMGAIIWQKVTTCNTTGGATVMGSFPYPRNGIIKIDYEFILLFKKPGKSGKVDRKTKEASKMTTEEWNTYFSGHWNFPGERQDKHLAMFPEELPRRLIKMFSFIGDTILDPFSGSGTTTLAAKNLQRNSLGYEINSEFEPVIRERVELDLFDKSKIEFIDDSCNKIDFKKELNKLPYIFKDPVKFDKKINPKKLTFGSRIDKKQTKRNNYFTVSRVIAPDTLILNNDLTIKLIGIKPVPKKEKAAIEFLQNKTKGNKVFLKFDEKKYNGSNDLLCYLYLKNKTFVNLHLVRTGFVDIDRETDYKYREKFMAERIHSNA